MSECFKYDLIESQVTVDGEKIVVYGIKCGDTVFEDISEDKSIVQEMLSRIYSEKLEPCHFMYFVQDEIDR